ncbi:MAG: hypothetical protein OXF01_16065 [Gemmatimonadetes bacterium]|nr:hypothetical protein [Gemmatimonadota bacterium]
MTAGTHHQCSPWLRIGFGSAASMVLAFAGTTNATLSAAQAQTWGVLVSPSVACREAPSHSASLADILTQAGDRWGERVSVQDSASDAAGEPWIAIDGQRLRGRCWVPEALVFPADGTSPLLVMADRLLEAPYGHSPDHWVAVHNYFKHPAYSEEVAASAILGLRRLEVLMGALRVAQLRWTDRPDPLVLAWLESLGDDVEYSPERGGRERWTVSRRALDALYEAHRNDPVAEEILWRISRYPHDPEQCRRSLRCLFDAPLHGVSRYWLTYPEGAFVGEAVQAAIAQIDDLGSGIIGSSVLGICEQARAAEPDSWQLEAWGRLAWEREGIAGARSLRAALGTVGEEDKAPLLDYLDELERCAAEVAVRLPLEEPEPVAATPAEAAADATPDLAEPVEETRELAVIASDVVCRSEPSRTASGYAVVRLDEHFTPDRPDTVAGGEAWVAVPNWSGCWIPRSDAAPAGTAEHVLAIADRFLTSGEGRTLDHSLRVYNVLASRHLGHRAIVDTSAVLTLRRLQVLRQVLIVIDPTFHAPPLVRGWATQLDDEVWLWSIGAQWLVRDDTFLRTYEAYRESPRAEEILWEFATGPTPNDCEGSFGCSATVGVMNKLARYWSDYPRGRQVARAVEIAAARLDGFLKTCEDARGAEPGSRAANRWRWANWDPDGAEVAGEMRATLADVGEADKAPLLALLDGVDQCAAAIGGINSRR